MTKEHTNITPFIYRGYKFYYGNPIVNDKILTDLFDLFSPSGYLMWRAIESSNPTKGFFAVLHSQPFDFYRSINDMGEEYSSILYFKDLNNTFESLLDMFFKEFDSFMEKAKQLNNLLVEKASNPNN